MPNWKKIIVSGSSASLQSLNVTDGITGSLDGNSSTSTSSSYALSASYLIGAVDPFPYTGDAQITGSLTVTGSLDTTGAAVFGGSVTATNLSGTNTGDETLSSINALAITSVGTIATGVWNGTAITDTYIASSAVREGTNNVAVGYLAMDNNINGYQNVAVGPSALATATGINTATAIGSSASEYNTGNGNTAIGYYALRGPTSGTVNGNGNTAVGNGSLKNLTTSNNSTALGASSGQNITTGGNNTMIGASAGSAMTTNSNNTLIGVNAGFALNSTSAFNGNENTFIGKFAGSSATTTSKSVIIGSNNGSSIATLSNRIIISDGDGNIRQTFDNVGAASFLGALSGTSATFSSSVSIGGADQGYQLDVKRTSTGDATFDTVANFYKASTHDTGLLLRLKNTIVDLAANNITGGGGPSAGMSFSVSSGGTISTALSIASTGAATFSAGVGINGATSTNGVLEVLKASSSIAQFSLGWNTSNHTDMYVDATGNFYLQPQGTTQLTIASTGAATFSGQINANNGISFPTPSPASSGTVASSVLDAYEEGTWTQTISTAGYTGVTYVSNETIGSYTRIGNIVTAFFYIRFSGTYVSGGNVAIDGLPYAVNERRKGGAITYTDLALNKNTLTAYPSVNSIYLYTNDIGSAGTLASPTADANVGYIIGSVTYSI